jgi:hypothetical protein
MMKGVRYRRILDEKLERFMIGHGTTHFLHDCAPCHNSKIVSTWFKERPNIKLIDWPGNSPDLNPIENVWSWMKMQQLRCSKAKNLKELQREVTELWVLKLDNLVESMPRRLQDIIDREGNPTRY